MTMDTNRILIVDDEDDFRTLLVEALASMGYAPEGAETAEKAIAMARETHYAIIFTDLNMPGGQSGLDLLHAIQKLDPKTFCILMTGYATTESAIQALKNGAYDFIQKPFKLAELDASLVRALDHYKSLRENEAYQSRLEEMVLERTQEILGLKEEIEKLFEGFVQASVVAIEARDPSTSGHSSRVADLTVGLAEAVNRTPNGPYGEIQFSDEQIREVRYASLLHDFGKVGVKEQVLTKARKLEPERLERILQRLYQRDLEAMASRVEEAWRRGDPFDPSYAKMILAARRTESQRIADLVVRCNEPKVLPQEIVEAMDELESLDFFHWMGNEARILEPSDISALRIPKGSLSKEERDEINSHVSHTFKFLEKIPWTGPLKNLPNIAYAHHERLNGMGYPRQLKADQIPPQSKLMAISDVYDALVAADRPYKEAVSIPRSLEILEAETKAGLLDAEVLRIFIESKIYELTRNRLKVGSEHA
jgi:response regulator RpfG family c-di-GMP phosphodiesterase